MSLRELVRLRILGDGARPWNDRVVEMPAASAKEQYPPVGELPWVGIRLGTQTLGTFGDFGTTVEVWPHAEPSTWQEVDALVGQLIPLLDDQILREADGSGYLIQYNGLPFTDQPVLSWDAYTRPLRFIATALAWLNGLTYSPDPIAGIRTWLATKWPTLQTNPDLWEPRDEAPAVYVRFTTMPYVQSDEDRWLANCTWYTAVVGLHVVAPSQATRDTWVRRIAEELGREPLIPFDSAFMKATVTLSDPTASPVADGQLRLEIRYRVLGTQVVEPLTTAVLEDGSMVTSVVRFS